MSKKILNEELNRLSVDAYKSSTKSNFVVILDNIRSMNNVGSVFRTSDSFLCEKIYLCGITSKPPHRDIQKTALGATESVDWEHVESTLEIVEKLKSDGFKIVAIEQVENSVKLNNFKPEKNQKYAFIFGHEVKGVSQDVVDNCDFSIEIPQFGTKHSLNISISAGIVIWDFVLKSLKNN